MRKKIIRHKVEPPRYRVNQAIRALEVKLIDDEGNFLGIKKIEEALALAQEKELDLVEISPKDIPPVCKILDYGQFKYKEEKERLKQKVKAKKVEVKGVRLSLGIKEHDLTLRKEQVKKFIDDGDKVKVEMILKGREKAHFTRAYEIIKKFCESLSDITTAEGQIMRQGGKLHIILQKRA